MKKKVFNGILLGTAAMLCAGGFAACEVTDGKNDGAEKTQIEEVYECYVAYAKKNGETPLSYEDWLASIKGEKGEKGDKGDTGAQGEKGDKGDTGAQGEKGDKGDTGAQGEKGEKGDTGAQGEKGEKGDTGAQGEKGDKGDTGADGKSAYEIWLEQGNTGSEEDFLDWLKGITPGEENKLSFKTLEIKDDSANLTVNNATKEFSFKDEIAVSGSSQYIVALDEYGGYQFATKIVPLEAGDNQFYIFETLGGEIVKTYTINIRRRPMYTVSFYTGNGSELQSVQVEEGFTTVAPESAPDRLGYTFAGWNFDFSQKITQNTQIAAQWTANTNTAYKVEYYLQDLESESNYSLHETENLTGTTDTTANAEIKSFAHFTFNADISETQGNIAPDGSLVLKVYYTRDSYTVTFNGNGGVYPYYGNETQKTYTVKYGGKVTAPEFTRTGYTQNGWDQPLPETISGNLTLTAAWQVNQYTLTLVLGGGLENKTITQDYGSAIEVKTPEREGYDFIGWDQEIPETMPAENIIVYSNWNAIFELSQNGDTITGLTDYGKNKMKLIIPEAIDGVKITNIDSRAFQKSQTVVNEKDNLKYIGSKDNPYLFLVKASKNLATYGIDSGCKYIGGSAFSGCSGLVSIAIPDSVTSIGDYAFSGCSGLVSITILDSVTSIGDYAFRGCSRLTSITIPNSVTSIGKSAFSGCSRLTSVTIPDSVLSIGNSVFSGCSGLENINVAVENTKYRSVGNCVIETATNTLIFGCKNSVIPTGGSVTTIGNSAFSGCSGLTSVTIPNSVTSIGDYAFSGCSGLTSVTIPNSVTSIGASAFSACSGLINLTIPDSVISIGASAFAYCSGLINLTIPDSVTSSIGNYTFYNCSGLTSVTIPDSVLSIGNSAFSGCSGLTSITIPNSVTSIGSLAFFCCSGLTSVTIGNRVTSIGDSAFKNCHGLTSVVIGNSVTSIGASAFSACSGLINLTIPDSVTSIGDYAFSGCSGLTSVTIGNSVTSIGISAFGGCSKLTSVSIPDSVTSIGNSAFSGCRGLTSVTIPDSVTSIGYSAFSGCSGLTSITIGNSVTSIGDSAFKNCHGLTSVVIGNSVTSIGASAFSGCSGLTSVTIPNSVLSIGNSAFSGCSGLTSVTIPNSVLSIGNSAFSGCSGLTSVTIGNGVIFIGSSVFSGCAWLDKIYYQGTADDWNKIDINCNNEKLTSATRYYYSETKPTESGNYWHYKENGEIEEW